MFQKGLVFPHPYALSFLSYCNTKNHIQAAEEIMLVFACWILIHVKCEVRCGKMVMNSVSQEARKILLEKYIMGKERRESWNRKERGTWRRKVKHDQLKFPLRAPSTHSSGVEIGGRGCLSACKPWISFRSLYAAFVPFIALVELISPERNNHLAKGYLKLQQ